MPHGFPWASCPGKCGGWVARPREAPGVALMKRAPIKRSLVSALAYAASAFSSLLSSSISTFSVSSLNVSHSARASVVRLTL